MLALTFSSVSPGHADGPQLSYEEAWAAVCQPQYDWPCEFFVAVAWRESNWKPQVTNEDCDLSKTYTMKCHGFLQLWDGWGTKEQLYDLYYNIGKAYSIYLEYGLTPWGG